MAVMVTSAAGKSRKISGATMTSAPEDIVSIILQWYKEETMVLAMVMLTVTVMDAEESLDWSGCDVDLSPQYGTLLLSVRSAAEVFIYPHRHCLDTLH